MKLTEKHISALDKAVHDYLNQRGSFQEIVECVESFTYAAPPPRIAEEIRRSAMEVVNQLFDLAEVPVDMRQSVNDRADEYVIDRLNAYASQFRNVVTDEEIEIRLAISIFAATPEFERGFYTGGREMAKWMREKMTGK